jgi:alanyl-tRNA synthetase
LQAVHVLAREADLRGVGTNFELVVDTAHRKAFPIGHSACHLAALAMKYRARSFWREDLWRTDSLEVLYPDGMSIDTSKIEPMGATDRYMLGKSMRKICLFTAYLMGALPQLQSEANETPAEWISTVAQ